MKKAEAHLSLELEQQLRFETLLSDISSHFINISVDQVNNTIEDSQRRICECLSPCLTQQE